jgi:hypothetical protein
MVEQTREVVAGGGTGEVAVLCELFFHLLAPALANGP